MDLGSLDEKSEKQVDLEQRREAAQRTRDHLVNQAAEEQLGLQDSAQDSDWKLADEKSEKEAAKNQAQQEDTGCNGTCTVLMWTPADQPVRRCGRQCGRRGGHSEGPARCMCRGHLDTQAPSPPSTDDEEWMTRLERRL